jgi:glycosyltransferase involved in cell wall biosynthesis
MSDQAAHQVGVITRTKDRPLLLERARASVLAQTFSDYLWVLVNDGGQPEPVDQAAAKARQAGARVEVIHHPESQGMEAASNAGIAAAACEFIVIHDDDDTWQPGFLRAAVDFLSRNDLYQGVVSQSWKVDEVISGDGVKILNRTPYNPHLLSIYLADLAVVNLFPPISFLYRRGLWEQLGGYDPSLPVLGDWEFNLRFLEAADIGVIPEMLANYHFRARVDANQAVYGNTVTHGVDQHVAYDALVRNKLLRRDLSQGRVGLGHLVSLGRQASNFKYSLRGVEGATERLDRFLNHTSLGRALRRLLG